MNELDSTRKGTAALANNLLLVLVFATVFLIPLFPSSYHWLLYNLAYTGIYLVATLAIERHRRLLVSMALTVIAVEWLSELLDLPLLNGIAGTFNVLFFILIVGLLIAQIARSKRVSARLIVESINGYLLLGLLCGLLVTLLAEYQPGAYNLAGGGSLTPEAVEERSSELIYYAFVTMTTVGYGDLLPLTSQSRSLAVLMGMTGQLYLAVVLATLVGKYASRPRQDGEE